jgi:hypothetical protein
MTMPVFIIMAMFIVQIAHFMVGLMVVNYAAFAAARYAIVWVPAAIEQGDAEYDKPNRLPEIAIPGQNNGILLDINSQYITSSRKCQEIFAAAAKACAIASPSKAYATGSSQLSQSYATATQNAYAALIPGSTSNFRIPGRLSQKLKYSFENTSVRVDFIDLNSERGPTYNPIGHPVALYYPHEVGWQDPLMVTVEHKFALFPGPGKYLAAILVDQQGNRSTVSDRVDQSNGIFKTTIKATAMLTNEGRLSLRTRTHPTTQEPDHTN